MYRAACGTCFLELCFVMGGEVVRVFMCAEQLLRLLHFHGQDRRNREVRVGRVVGVSDRACGRLGGASTDFQGYVETFGVAHEGEEGWVNDVLVCLAQRFCVHLHVGDVYVPVCQYLGRASCVVCGGEEDGGTLGQVRGP